MVALSVAGSLLFGSATFFGPLQRLLCHHRGPGAVRGLLFPGLHLSSILVWTAAVLNDPAPVLLSVLNPMCDGRPFVLQAVAVVSPLVSSARRRQHSQDVLTVAQVAGYVMRRHKKSRTENDVKQKVKTMICLNFHIIC